MLKIAYIDRKESIHSKNLCSSLSDFFDIKTFYGKDLIENRLPERELYDLILIGEVDFIPDYLFSLDLPLVGISWTYDLNRLRLAKNSNSNDLVNLLKLDAILVDCNFQRNYLMNIGYPNDSVFQMPYGIDLDFYKFTNHRKIGEKFKIYSNRRWEKGYGQETLFEACEILKSRNFKFQIKIAGEGSIKNSILSRFQNRELDECIELIGEVDALKNIQSITSSNLFISASNSDGISVSILESMALGTPILATNIPTNYEFIEDSINGFLFSNGNAQDLAVKIMHISKTRNINLITSAARRKVEAFANWDKNIHDFSSFLKCIINNH